MSNPDDDRPTRGGPVIEVQHPVPMGIWRHYKGGFYQVIGIGQHSETGERLVIYIALTGIERSGPRIRCRPLNMWHDLVNMASEGQEKLEVRRFEFWGTELDDDQRELAKNYVVSEMLDVE